MTTRRQWSILGLTAVAAFIAVAAAAWWHISTWSTPLRLTAIVLMIVLSLIARIAFTRATNRI